MHFYAEIILLSLLWNKRVNFRVDLAERSQMGKTRPSLLFFSLDSVLRMLFVKYLHKFGSDITVHFL